MISDAQIRERSVGLRTTAVRHSGVVPVVPRRLQDTRSPEEAPEMERSAGRSRRDRSRGRWVVPALLLAIACSLVVGPMPVTATNPEETRAPRPDRTLEPVLPGVGNPEDLKRQTAENPSTDAGAYPAGLCNALLAVQVSDDARFNLGTYPNPSDCSAGADSWDMLFSWPGSPWSSYSTVRVDGADWVYGSSGTVEIAPVQVGPLESVSGWRVGGVRATQTVQIVPNPQTGRTDLLRVSYQVVNPDAAWHRVGMRVLLDTELSGNDGAAFRRTGWPTITHETEFYGTGIPTVLEALSDNTDSPRTAEITLRGTGSAPPDRVVLAAWPHLYPALFDYYPDSSFDFTDPQVAAPDSALAAYWEEVDLAPGATRTFTILVGMPRSDGSAHPSVGPWSGGNNVMLTGTGMTAATSVRWGTENVSFTHVDDHAISLTVPKLPAPTVDAQHVTYEVRAGTRTLASGTYTYRGLAIVLLRGITSRLPLFATDKQTDGFWDVNAEGLRRRLIDDKDVPPGAFLDFSYTGGTMSGARWTPSDYRCSDTFLNPAADARVLDTMLNNYLAAHDNVDVYLVGHSKGGVVAMTYLAWLVQQGRSTGQLTSYTSAGVHQGRLAGVVTLDSPIGGIDPNAFNALASVRCGLDMPRPSRSAFMLVMAIASASGLWTPLGGSAHLGLATTLSDRAGTNDDLAASVSRTDRPPEGPSVLTIGNWADDVFSVGTPSREEALTTQWLTRNEWYPYRAYSRQIDRIVPGIIEAFGYSLNVKWANHSVVMADGSVANAIHDLLRGVAPREIAGDLDQVPAARQFTAAQVDLAASPAITGTVLGSTGDPLEGIGVAAISTTSPDVFFAATGPGGMFSASVPPGTYLLAFADPNGVHPAGYAGAAGFTTDLASARPVVLAADGVDIAVVVPDGRQLSGTVVDDGQVALAERSIRVLTPGGRFVAGAITDAGGAFSVAVEPGSYVVAVEGGGTRASSYYGATGAQPSLALANIVPVSDADVSSLDIVLPPVATLSGSVLDESGAPRWGIRVTASSADGTPFGTTTTDENGGYVMGLDPGTYTVAFEDPTTWLADGYLGVDGYVSSGGQAAPVTIQFDHVAVADVVLPSSKVPSAPRGVTARAAGPGRAWIEWAPGEEGGGPVRWYIVYAYPGGAYCYTRGSIGCQIGELTGGASYTFSVIATNLVGDSPEAVSAPFRAVDVSAAPFAVQATPTIGGAVVTWMAPPSNGGASLAGYTVLAEPGGAMCSTSGLRSCTFGGLDTGTAYTFSVLATNSVGDSPYSWPSAPIVPLRDTVPPVVSAPKAAFPLAVQTGSGTVVPVRLTWTGSDASSGIDHFVVQLSTNGGAYSTIATTIQPTVTVRVTPSATSTRRFRVTAIDRAGNASTGTAGPSIRVTRFEDSSASIRYSGKWSRVATASASGGAFRRASASGASATFKFTGRAVAWVATVGPTYGKARVYVDGVYRGIVDLHAATTSYRWIELSRTWSASGAHKVRIVCAGTAGHPRVSVDAFVVIR